MNRKKLSRAQRIVLGAATIPMIAAGAAGGWGTYTNVAAEFDRAATALGVVAAGEGVTLILALVMVGLTMLGQASPEPVRFGLWLAPVAAAITGIVIADDGTEGVVYGITPMAMSAAAEGLGLLARRVVVFQTGVDMEAQRRNAATMQQLAVARAVAANHPDEDERQRADLRAWELAAEVGVGDAHLGSHLVDVQRDRLGQGADDALARMLTMAPQQTTSTKPSSLQRTATAKLSRHFADMDPADVIRISHDSQPELSPSQLAALLRTYGVNVDAVQVALVLLALHGRPAKTTVDRDDADDAPRDAPADAHDAPQVTAGTAPTKAQAILTAAAVLGPDFTASEIADRVQRINRITVKPGYVRAVLSRAKKDTETGQDHMEGGYA
ncbi:conjugal transfer protein [Streptomyces sp. NPDC051569]|uniref:conjugal transfer protein n=1 Tax=Streptomyces sp. NPDC051569 TaxID=3365661 RepID=UPI00378E903D